LSWAVYGVGDVRFGGLLAFDFLALMGWGGGVCISVYILHLVLRQGKPRSHSYGISKALALVRLVINIFQAVSRSPISLLFCTAQNKTQTACAHLSTVLRFRRVPPRQPSHRNAAQVVHLKLNRYAFDYTFHFIIIVSDEQNNQ